MVRKTALAVAAALVVLGAGSPSASAQDPAECTSSIATNDSAPTPGEPVPTEVAHTGVECAVTLPDPGPFVERPSERTGPLGWGLLSITIPSPKEPAPNTVGPVAVETPVREEDNPAPIAHTGTEIVLLAYLGTGLVAFGAVALGTRRRYFIDDED